MERQDWLEGVKPRRRALTLHEPKRLDRILLSGLGVVLSTLAAAGPASARYYFFRNNPYFYHALTQNGIQDYTGTISGYFEYSSSVNNDISSPNVYGPASVTTTASPYSYNLASDSFDNSPQTFTNWGFHNVESAYGTRLLFWNNSHSLEITINQELNSISGNYLTINSNPAAVNRFCFYVPSDSDPSTIGQNGYVTNQYECGEGTDMTFTGDRSIAPAPVPLLGLLPLGVLAFRRKSMSRKHHMESSPTE